MGGDAAPPTGPDLASGIPSDQLTEDQALAGRVGDDAVLLARSGGRCYAVGAKCTHYSVSLADGLVVDGTIRCPGHHAAFRLDTGQATRPPAFDALPCWRVEETDGVIRVLDRITDAAPRRSAPSAGTAIHASVVIIGAGAAGVSAADTLRKEGHQGRITMVDADSAAPVDRPNLSKDYLAGTAPEEWMTLRGDDWFTDHDITLARGRQVTSLELSRKEVALDDGTTFNFERLLIAAGASAVQVESPGANHLPVFTLRSLADSRAIIAAADRAGAGASAVVLGSSFIALEVSASLRARGMQVHVVAPHTNPLEKVLGPALGTWIHQLHLQHGVIFHLGRNSRALQPAGVLLDDGQFLPASFVVAGIGVRPNSEFARRAGLRVEKGIVVDSTLQTSASGVYAAGDVASYPDARTGQLVNVQHWVAAQRQGQTAGRNLIGFNERFIAPPFFWSAHYDATISYVGHAETWDRIEMTGSLEARDCEVRYIAGSQVLAVATIGRDRANLEQELAMEREVFTR